MRAAALAALALLAACGSDNSSTPAPQAVKCAGANITPGVNTCTIDFGTCDDSSSYVLACGVTGGALLICNCQIDNVYEESQTVEIVNSCDASITQQELLRAWLDCGVNMSLSM